MQKLKECSEGSSVFIKRDDDGSGYYVCCPVGFFCRKRESCPTAEKKRYITETAAADVWNRRQS